MFTSPARTARRSVAVITLALASFAGVVLTASPGGATALPQRFSSVFENNTGMAVVLNFRYTGTGPVTLTVSTNAQNIDGTKVATATAYKVNPNTWAAAATGLNSGTAYAYRLRAADSADYVQVWTKTLTRDVIVDFDRVDVLSDGDAWPNGCGDLTFTFVISGRVGVTPEMCIDSGSSVVIPEAPGTTRPGYRAITDALPSFQLQFWARDDDNCRCSALSDYYCKDSSSRSADCADLAYKITSWDFTAAGTQHRPMYVNAEGVEAIAWAWVTVTYHK